MIALSINIVLVLINAFYAIAKKRENKILLIISFSFLFLLMAGYRGSYKPTAITADMYNYSRGYEGIKYGTIIGFIEPGYRILVTFFSRYLHFDFLAFYMTIHFLCLSALFYMGKKFSNNRHIIIALFSAFLHIYSCEQFQTYIALTIATFALCHLLYSEKEGIDYKYIIGIVIASLFHYTMISFFIFILVDIKNKKILIRGGAAFIVIFCIVELITDSRLDLNSLLSVFPSIKQVAARYFTSSRLGWLYGVLFQFSTIFISYFNMKQIKFIKTDNECEIACIKRVTERVMWINLLGIVFFPLYMINTQLIRFARGILLINFIVCGSIAPKLPLKKRAMVILLYVLWCLCYGYVYLVYFNNATQSVFWPFFQLNAFF